MYRIFMNPYCRLFLSSFAFDTDGRVRYEVLIKGVDAKRLSMFSFRYLSTGGSSALI